SLTTTDADGATRHLQTGVLVLMVGRRSSTRAPARTLTFPSMLGSDSVGQTCALSALNGCVRAGDDGREFDRQQVGGGPGAIDLFSTGSVALPVDDLGGCGERVDVCCVRDAGAVLVGVGQWRGQVPLVADSLGRDHPEADLVLEPLGESPQAAGRSCVLV